jgi:protein SCO1/2
VRLLLCNKFIFLPLVVILLIGCKETSPTLPILGEPTIAGNDTNYPTIANFSFINQDSNIVTNQTFENKVYVADFIFLSCPTICPKMTREMYSVYLHFAKDDRVLFISHTIDPERDTIPALKAYAKKLGVNSNKWHFVTGNQDSILNLSEFSYFSAAYPDSTSPGGFTHSGGLLLVDKNRHIRGVYNSTNPEETKRLVKDVKILLNEQF